MPTTPAPSSTSPRVSARRSTRSSWERRAACESSRRCARPWSRGARRFRLAGRPEARAMRIGISLLNNWGIEDAQALVGLAGRAEELGFDSVLVHDHVFNVGHVFDRIGGKPYYEPLTLLSFVAARTRRIRLGTSVLVLPYHNPIRLAKTAATLDVLSGGRLILGVGVGAIENEMEAMGTPFKERGAFTDEAITVMRTLWNEEDPRFVGTYSRFAGMKFSPKPLQKPSIPLVIAAWLTPPITSGMDGF